jgi:hypothetical protein
MIHDVCKPVEGERVSFEARSRARLREGRRVDSLSWPSLRNNFATLASEENLSAPDGISKTTV